MSNAVYQDPARSTQDRIDDLIGRMTLDEKIAQLTAVWITLDDDSGEFAPLQSSLQLMAGDLDQQIQFGIGQICRPYGSTTKPVLQSAAALNAFQKKLIETTRLGIPALAHEECLNGVMVPGAVEFPSAVNFGATWNPSLLQDACDEMRNTMRALGVYQGLAPVADVARDLRWGRVEECFGEDPYLAGIMASAFCNGLQGEDLSNGVIATLKHFAGYAMSEGGRNFAPAQVGRRFLEENVLTPFEMAVRGAGAESVMNAYQEIDGIPCAASKFLLTELLRDRWAFKGTVVADYFSVFMLYSLHKIADTPAAAAPKALAAGLDVELPTPICFPVGIKHAIETDALSIATVNQAVRRVLRHKFETGLFDQPFVSLSSTNIRTAKSERLSKQLADQSICLLKNDGVLPIEGSKKIALIGPDIIDGHTLMAGYTFTTHVGNQTDGFVRNPRLSSIAEAMKCVLPDAQFLIEPGIRLIDPERSPKNVGQMSMDLTAPRIVLSDDRSRIPQAVEAARKSDLAVVCIGDKSGHFGRGTSGEGTDVTGLKLPGLQKELAEAVLATETPTIIILTAARPYPAPNVYAGASAVLFAGLPGEFGAAAIADALTGIFNPSGKLTLSVPEDESAQPLVYNGRRLAKGMPRQPGTNVAFSFGHGLSYTQFEYTNLSVSHSRFSAETELNIAVELENTGDVSGAEIVQLYITDPIANLPRNELDLKGFCRVELEPGERCKVEFTLPTDLLMYVGETYQWVLEPGTFTLHIAASATDIRQSIEIEYTGPTISKSQRDALTSSASFFVIHQPERRDLS